MSDLMTVAQGLSCTWTITLRDAQGRPFTGYTGTELLAGSVRSGRDSPPLIVLAPTWIDATQGLIKLPIPGSATAALDVGRYLVQVSLANGSADLFEGYLSIQYSPGTAADLPVYGTYGDILDCAPWIEKLQKNTDTAGFVRQRNQARTWFDDLIQRHDNGGSGGSTDFAFVPGESFGGSLGIGYRDGRRSRELQSWLDANRLDVTAPVIDAVTSYAIALICQRQVSSAGSDPYAQQASRWMDRAETTAMEITAEIDSNGDGVNDYAVRLGSYDTLDG